MYFINVLEQKHLSFLLLLLLVLLLLANQNQHLINLQGRRFDSTLKKIQSHLLLWEKPRTQELSDLIQDRLRRLQNPPDCSRANKILCRLSRDRCGFGCELHHAVFCLMMAYGTNRTLIYKTEGFGYSKDGFNGVFKQLSNNCNEWPEATHNFWPGKKGGPTFCVINFCVIHPFFAFFAKKLHPRFVSYTKSLIVSHT